MILHILLLLCEFLVVWSRELHQSECYARYENDDGILNGWVDIPLQKIPRSHRFNLELQLAVEDSLQGNQIKESARIVSSANFQNVQIVLPSWKGNPPEIKEMSINGVRICSNAHINPNPTIVILKTDLHRRNRLKRSPYSDSSNLYSNNPFLSKSMDQHSKSISFHPTNEKIASSPYQPFADNPFLSPNKMKQSDVIFHETHYTKPDMEINMDELYSNPFLKNIMRPNIDVRREKNNDVNWRPEEANFRHTKIQDEEETDDYDCGVPIRVTPLIAHGVTTADGAHPWLGALYGQKETGLELLCGSTLVSKKHVVTAAHCVQLSTNQLSPEEVWIVLGRKNLNQWSYNDDAEIIQAGSIHVHPDYKGITYANFSDADVAVIQLSEEVTFSLYVLPACLWSGSTRLKNIVGKKGVVAGWGRDESGDMAAEASEIKLPVVSEEDCLRSNEAFMMLTSNRTFCAGYRDDSGPCKGDSGSGFLMKEDGKWTLRGVVSLAFASESKKKCNLKEYVVFADIAQHLDWVLSILKK